MNLKWCFKAFAGFLIGLAMSSPVLYAGEAFSVPVSDQVVEGQITFKNPSGREVVVQFTSREGTMVTVHDASSGIGEGWVAKLDSAGQPIIRSFHITPLPPLLSGTGKNIVQEKIVQVGDPTLVTLGSFEEFAMPSGVFRVEAQSVRQASFPNIRLINPRGANPDNLQKIYGKSGGGNCCVTCGGITVCATEVSMDCGSCSAFGGGGFRVY